MHLSKGKNQRITILRFTRLNTPKLHFQEQITSSIRTRSDQMHVEIWDVIRKKWLVCTPEEWVRQHCIEYLILFGYSSHHVQVESGLTTIHKKKRSDIIANINGKPHVLVECKAPSIKLNQDTFNQAFNYNTAVNAPFIWITNGMQHLYWDCTRNCQIKALPAL